MKLRRYALLVAATISAFSMLTLASVSSATAQGYANMTCGELWHARNRIYADAGYCFKTARGRRAFGRGCFPPYGRLRSVERNEVNQIQSWEAQNGC